MRLSQLALIVTPFIAVATAAVANMAERGSPPKKNAEVWHVSFGA